MERAEISQEERKEFQDHLNRFLTKRKWKRREFESKTIYLKEGVNYPPDHFLEKPRKRRLPPLSQGIRKIIAFFPERGYEEKVQDNIVNTGKVKDTFLIGAGVQYFRECFWGDKGPTEGSFFLPQPVIRMQYANSVKEGSTSSFVNASTVQLQSSFREHLVSLDNWFDLFSEQGLYMGDFNLEVVSPERYGRGKKGKWKDTDGFSVNINYLNQNIGDAGFIRVQTKRGPLEVSDIGFGLERILWSLYKTPSYFDLIGPISETRNLRFQLVDSIRSATLLGMSNISDKDQNSYNQFKKFVKYASDFYGQFDLFKLIRHYHNFWSEFINPQRGSTQTYYFLDREIGEFVHESRDL